MDLDLKFTIEEAPHAQSIIFKDVTGNYHTTLNPGGWGSSTLDPDDVEEAKLIMTYNEVEYEVELPVVADFLDIWTIGYEVSADTFGIGNIFPDGVYDFRVEIVDNSDNTYPEEDPWAIVVGFAAIITREVMKDSLTYHPSKQRSHRDWITEQHRLLDNLRYSAHTGNIMYFRDNLAYLQKIR